MGTDRLKGTRGRVTISLITERLMYDATSQLVFLSLFLPTPSVLDVPFPFAWWWV